MTKRLNIYLLVFTLVVLISCKKENSKKWTTVSVSFTHAMTGDTVPVGHAEVMEDSYKYFVLNQLDLQHDVQGQYHFGFEAKQSPDYDYYLYAYPDFDTYVGVDFEGTNELVKNTDNVFHYTVMPYGTIFMNVKNVSCFDENDHLAFSFDHIGTDDYGAQSPINAYGCADKTWDLGKKYAGTYTFEWVVTKNGVTQTYYDTLSLAQGQNLVYDLNY